MQTIMLGSDDISLMGQPGVWNKSIIIIPYEMSLQAWARAGELEQACDCEE